MTHNLDQALRELSAEAAAVERATIERLRRATVATMVHLVRTSVVKRGNYRRHHLAAINEVSKRKFRRGRRISRLARGNKYGPEANARIRESSDMFARFQRLAEIRRITIVNNAPYAHLVERKHRQYEQARAFAEAQFGGRP
jgi:hypothetical protein